MSAIGSSTLSTSVVAASGTPFYNDGTVLAIPGSSVTVFSITVPGGVTRKLESIIVTSLSPGTFELESAGLVVASGVLYEAEKNVTFKFDPPRPISTGTLIELKFIADAEPTTGCPVSGYLSANDF